MTVLKNDIEYEGIAFGDNSFELVIFSEILEHLRIDPLSTLREILRVLTPGGTLILSTPNLYSIGCIIKFNTGRGLNDPYREFEKLHSLGLIRIYSAGEVK